MRWRGALMPIVLVALDSWIPLILPTAHNVRVVLPLAAQPSHVVQMVLPCIPVYLE